MQRTHAVSGLTALLIPFALLDVAGCSGLLHSTAQSPQLYVLQTPVVAAPTAASGAQSPAPTLRIARPLAAPGLNTDRIALMRPGNRLDYYAGARWSAPLGEVVSDLQMSVFRADPAWSAVVDERSALNVDYVLQTSIIGFAAEYATESGVPQVLVQLQCLVSRRSDGALLGSFAVTQAQPAAQNRMSDVVAAFSMAAGKAVSAAAVQADQLLRSAKSPAAP